MKDRFVKICLAMIVVLLGLVAWRQEITIVHAATPREYKVIIAYARVDVAASIEKMINEQAKNGWELVQGPVGSGGLAIFKK